LILDGKPLQIRALSNSQIIDLKAESGTVSLRVQTPLFMGGYVNITLPTSVRVVDVLLDKEPLKFQAAKEGGQITYSVLLREGTHEIALTGTEASPQASGGAMPSIPLAPVLAVVAVSVAAVIILRTRKGTPKRRTRRR